jgi:GrpB-like predicted nucleotidyltransferase (UPF0157 family)
MAIEVVDYDDAWPGHAEAACAELRDCLRGPGRNELLLRDYLRTHPAEAQRYADLKRDLAVRYEASADYTRAKTELIQELTDRARAARGLPSVPVREERAKPASPGLCPSFVGSATSIVSAT